MVFFETIKPGDIITKSTLWICIVTFLIASIAGFYTAIETDVHVKTTGGAYTLQWALAIILLICFVVSFGLAWFIPSEQRVVKAICAVAAVFFLLLCSVGSGIMTFNSQVGGIYQNTSGACQPIAGSAVQFFTLFTGLSIVLMLFFVLIGNSFQSDTK